jgi:hypothetical protein
MVIDPIQLLKRLEPAVRPVAAPAGRTDANAPLEQQSFDELLSLVSHGRVHSGRAVRVADDAALSEPLTDEQVQRLAAAADRAEAAGARRAVMLIDGRGVVMDVPQRTISTELTSSDRSITRIDAAVYVAGEDDAAGDVRPPGLRAEGLAASAAAARDDRSATVQPNEEHSGRRAG